MPLHSSTIADLTTERGALLKRRQDIDERLAAIDLLLRHSPSSRRQVPAPPARKQTGSGTLPFQGDGLRGSIRKVLAQGAVSPSEAIRALNDGGYRVSGKTPLTTRVYNELKRLKDDGSVERNPDGKYCLVERE